jgi:hypothetical protein
LNVDEQLQAGASLACVLKRLPGCHRLPIGGFEPLSREHVTQQVEQANETGIGMGGGGAEYR